MIKEKESNLTKNVVPVLRIILGFVFLLTALLKLYDVTNFSQYLTQFGFIPFPSLIAKFVIIIELILGIFLINKLFAKKTIYASGLLIGVFWLVAIMNLFSKNSVESCQCFGPVSLMNTSSLTHLLFLLIISIALILMGKRRKGDKILLSKSTKNFLNGVFFITSISILFFTNSNEVNDKSVNSLASTFEVNILGNNVIEDILRQRNILNKNGESVPLDALIEPEKKINIISFFAPTQCFSCLQYIKEVSKKEFRNENNFKTKFIIFNTAKSEIKYFLKNYGIENYNHLYFLGNAPSLSEGNATLYEMTPNVMFISNSLEILGNYSSPRDPKYQNVFIDFLVKRNNTINNEAFASF